MADYIDRKKLIENLNTFAPEHYNALINMLIEKQPSVDLVSVVHCQDCKFTREKDRLEKAIYIEDALICENSEASEDGYMAVMPYHFCSYGERKDG